MPMSTYRCECGKVFKTAQGLAGHRRFCTKTVRPAKADDSIPEWEQKLSDLEKRYKLLSDQYAAALKKVDKLEELVNLLVGYVCPAGRNLVGVCSSRIIQLTQEIDEAKKEMSTNQKTFEKELTNFVYSTINK